MINYKTIFCLLIVLSITACDPFGFLDSNSKQKSRDKIKKEPRWTCTQIFSTKSFLFSFENQTVTVELENVIIPGCLSKKEKEFFDKQILLSQDNFKKYADDAFDFSSNLLFNMEAFLSPLPKKNDKYCNAHITVIPGGDVEARLLNEGLAMLKHDLKPEIKDKYITYQQKAMDNNNGLWSQCIANTNNFIIKVSALLTSGTENKVIRKNVKNLPKFYSPDLYNGPKFTEIGAKSIENISNAEMKLSAEAVIKIISAAKSYELTLRIQPHVIQKEFSGPLSAFKNDLLDWEENTIHAKGGEKVSLKVEYSPIEISRVIKGNNISVFTGALVESCDIEILSDGKIIYQTKKQFSRDITLNSLDNSLDSAF